MAIYVLYLQNNNGDTTKKEVKADSSLEAVNSALDGKWVVMSNKEIPRGMYASGTYSVERGYITVKKPNKVHDWFKRV
jgi:hypothetical protein